MRHPAKIRVGFLAIGGMTTFSLIGLFYFMGGYINTSSSIPLGIYWVTHNPVKKGEYVLFCPPQEPVFQEALARGYIQAGFCPGGFGYMMKRIVAGSGDVVSITPKGVWVNHQLVPYSMPLQEDKHKRPLEQVQAHQYRLHESEWLLMTNQSELSFDARYFGLIKQAQIKAVIKPGFMWPFTTDRNKYKE